MRYTRTTVAAILFILFSSISYGQGERNVWINWFYSMVSFNNDTAEVSSRPISAYVDRTNASICDKSGNLLFFTNGYRVFNRNYGTMQNGDSLETGEYIQDTGYDFMPSENGAVIIPMPDDSEKFYVFYFDLNFYYELDGFTHFYPNHLFYSIVDMSLDSGLGGIVSGQKNISLIDDTLTVFGVQAVKHGNGRDWWLFCHEYGSNRYYYFLVDNQGIHGPFQQFVGIAHLALGADTYDQMQFSNDGTKFCQLCGDSNTIELYDFNRCTAVLSPWENLSLIDTFTIWPPYAGGACFSGNNHLLYISDNLHRLYQFNLNAPNIQYSQTLIDTYDNSYDPFAAWFDFMINAPDGKIYMDEFNGNASLHVINHPDSVGLACNFVQRQFKLYPGTYWSSGVPNLPNYSLGPLFGSGCDTLTANSPVKQVAFTYGVYPNPCHRETQLIITGVDRTVQAVLYNTFGQLIEQQTLIPVNERVNHGFNLEQYPAGVYFLDCKAEKWSSSTKIVKR